MKHIANKLHDIFTDCLYQEDEIKNGVTPTDAVIVEGVIRSYGFHPGRLSQHKAEIAELIREMPREFMADSEAQGHSFLNLCLDKDGQQWGEHSNMEQLVVLAIATDQGRFLLPREVWPALPGGMPYLSFSPAA